MNSTFYKEMLECDIITHSGSVFSSDRPDPPQDLELSDLSARSVRLTWIPGNENNSPVTRTILSFLLAHKHRTISNIWRISILANHCRIWDHPSLQNSSFSMRRTDGDQVNGKTWPRTRVIRTLWTWICLRLWTTSSEWLLSTVWVGASRAGHHPATRPAVHVSDRSKGLNVPAQLSAATLLISSSHLISSIFERLTLIIFKDIYSNPLKSYCWLY